MALSETSERMVVMVKNPPLMPTTTGRELILLPVKAAKRKSGYLTSGCQLDVAGVQTPTHAQHPSLSAPLSGENSTSHANNYRQRAHTTSSQGGKKEERLPN